MKQLLTYLSLLRSRNAADPSRSVRPIEIGFTAAACIALGASAPAAAVTPSNNVPIQIYWLNLPRPTLVGFDDRQTGMQPFTRLRNYFEGRRRALGNWAEHEVTIRYEVGEMPLALRTRYTFPGIRLLIRRTTIPHCNQAGVRMLTTAPSRPFADALGNLIAARHLLVHDSSCSPRARQLLSAYYFRGSCTLARDFHFLLVSVEAKELFIQNAENEGRATEEAEACDEQLRSMVSP